LNGELLLFKFKFFFFAMLKNYQQEEELSIFI